MRKLNWLVFALIVGLVLTTSYIISAQQRDERRQRPGQGQQRQRRQMDPQEMIQRRVERTIQNLKLSDEEAAVLKPQIEGIMQIRMEQNREMRDFMDALQKAVEANDDAQIQAKLEEVKAKRKENKAKVEKMELDLVGLLTLKQEAQLTISGVVNSDGTAGFFGGGFRRQGRQNQQRQPGQQGR